MKLTKYEHACLVLELEGNKLVIDPGGFTPEFGSLDNIVAVVVTHVHPDHFDPEHLAAIVAKNPDLQIFAPAEVAAQAKILPLTAVYSGSKTQVGPFSLAFFGELHAEVHKAFPRPENVGVLVNNIFYYPGDSFTPPGRPVNALAVPVGATWLKIGEAIDFIQAVKPQHCFRTHDALLSERGLAGTDKWLEQAVEPVNATYAPLRPGESLEIADR